MKNSGFAIVVCLGMAVSAVGCGGATGAGQAEALGNVEQQAVCLDCEGGGGGGGGGGTTTETGMTLEEYQQHALTSTDRCIGGITWEECKRELDYGLQQQLISLSAYNWGVANGYYPVIDRYNKIGAVCKCGCFEANTLILTQDKDGFGAWLEAKKVKETAKLVALDEAATLTKPSFSGKSIKAFSRGEEKPALYVFGLDNGRQLKVTQNHGMLLSDGRVVEAKTLDVGAEFVAVDGSTVRVTNLSFENTKKDVYNFEVDASFSAGHIIAAEGVLVGDLAWQNQLGREIGSIVVRQ
ncbi:Hint domain-containing protein [Archangium gephyra]|uniref:Hint domain-containing protein n=1 Tax=Archangium gephyra TaxID=48 RepID=UPI0035D4D63E